MVRSECDLLLPVGRVVHVVLLDEHQIARAIKTE